MRLLLRPLTLIPRFHHVSLTRPLFTAQQLLKNAGLGPLPPILDADITENFLKGSGPGGQKINKTASAVQILHHPTGLIVKCQETRSRSQNRKIARRLLAERIEVLQMGSEARVEKRIARKVRKKSSAAKKSRRKYRALEAEKGAAGEGLEENEDKEDDVEDENDEHESEGHSDAAECKDKTIEQKSD